jgi:hypothetical protein
MKYIRKVKHTFHAIRWTEKPQHEVTIKQESFKDLSNYIRPLPTSSSIYNPIGMSYQGGSSKPIRQVI